MVLQLRFVSFLVCATLSFGSVSVAAAQEAQDLPPAPVVSSDFYTDPDRWYKAEGAEFTWELPSDVTRIAIDIATSTDAEPMQVIMPVSSYTIDPDDLVEGEQYLAVQFKNEAGWGEVTYYTLRIDRTVPQNLNITLVPGDTYPYTSTLIFRADDSLSGISGYSVYLGGNPPVFFTPEQARTGYQFSQKAEGTYRVVVVAFDQAGNSIANHFPVFVFDVDALIAKDDLIFGFITSDGFIFTTLALLTLLASWLAIHATITHRRKERVLRREVRDIEREAGKIFRALRDEIREQIDQIQAKKRITKNEQAVVNNLTRVLEVSETLVGKEVSDVKKLLK